MEAWRRLRSIRNDPKLHLLLIGSGNDAEELRRLIGEDAADVTWVDRYIADRPTMRRYLSSADLYVMTSRHEGFPVAPLEAMACALPVIASDAPGIEDIFAHGEEDGGVVVGRGDPTVLIEAIARLAGDAPLRASLGAKALERVRSAFHPNLVGQRLADFLFGGA
jgi:starch synthase